MVRSSARVAILATIALGACHHRTPSARDRVLGALPATARVVLAADGGALSSPTVRGAIDAARPFVPKALGCVIDAAQAADAAALALGSDGAVVAISTSAPIPACAALSQYERGLWIATVGAAAPADDRATSVATARTWARPRDYLLEAPLALAMIEPRLIAAARASPLELWLTVDGEPGATLVHLLDGWAGAKLSTTRVNNELIVKWRALGEAGLADLVRQTLHALNGPPPAPSGLDVTCTPTTGVVVSCRGHEIVVRSVSAALLELAARADQPVVSGDTVVGIRVRTDALAFHAGDVILALDAHTITSSAELAALAATVHSSGTLAVRRGDTDGMVDLRQEE